MIGSTEPIFPLLARALDVCALRQAVHSANIANASVEGYQRMEVDFEAELSRIGGSEFQTEIPVDTQGFGEPQITYTTDAVKLDQEMASMAQNALRYQALLSAFEKSTGLLRLAIREGRD